MNLKKIKFITYLGSEVQGSEFSGYGRSATRTGIIKPQYQVNCIRWQPPSLLWETSPDFEKVKFLGLGAGNPEP